MKEEKTAEFSVRPCTIYCVPQQVLQSNKILSFLNRSDFERYIAYITYQPQFVLYELFNKSSENISWNDFILFIRGNRRLINAARAVVRYGIESFPLQAFRFSETRKQGCLETCKREDEIIHMAKLLSDEEATHLLLCFMIKAQLAQYLNLSNSKNSDYSWETYLKDVNGDEEKLNTLFSSFHFSLHNIDFEACWLSDHIEETQFLRER